MHKHVQVPLPICDLSYQPQPSPLPFLENAIKTHAFSALFSVNRAHSNQPQQHTDRYSIEQAKSFRVSQKLLPDEKLSRYNTLLEVVATVDVSFEPRAHVASIVAV